MKNWYIICSVSIMLAALIKFFNPQIKGWFGEKLVAIILSQLNQEQYRIINDVILKTERGSSQIDHVVVSIYGIFVIETKNYKGWITGTEYGEQWTKNMYGKKYKFSNPLIQNYGHVKALEQLLELEEDKFIPIVVFSVDADLKIKTTKPVVYTVNLNKEIKKYNEVKFTIEEVNMLADKISMLNTSSYQTKIEHVNNVRAEIYEKHEKIRNGICPKCGGILVERKGKYGKFVGCNNYPKCRYIKK